MLAITYLQDNKNFRNLQAILDEKQELSYNES